VLESKLVKVDEMLEPLSLNHLRYLSQMSCRFVLQVISDCDILNREFDIIKQLYLFIFGITKLDSSNMVK
jgi:hypothetical protein